MVQVENLEIGKGSENGTMSPVQRGDNDIQLLLICTERKGGERNF
jgi:hypothetical protein